MGVLQMNLPKYLKRDSLIKKVAFLFLLILSFTTIFGATNPQLTPGRVVNDIKFYSATSNREVTLKELKGKNIIINFTATWCPYCIEEKKLFEKEWSSNYSKNRDLEVLVVFGPYGAAEKQDNLDKISNYMKSNNYSFPVYFDKDKSVLREFGVSSVPSTILIDKNGKIVESGAEYYKLEALKKYTISVK